MIKGSVFKRAISLLLTFTVLFATVLSTGISVDAQTVVSDGINNYETLAEAVASVAEGSELYLTSDIVLDDSLTVSKSVVIRSDYGHTITRSETFDGSMIELNGGTLTVAGITLDGEGKEASAPLVTVNSGTFRMLSGTLTGNNNVNEGGSALRLNGGTFDFSAGTISSNKCAGNGNAVYVAGGRFELSGYASFGASSDIYLSVSSVIYITDSLGSSVDTVNVSMSDLSVGRTVAELSYGVELTEEQISRFKISGSDEHLVTLFDGKLVVTSSGEPQPEIKDAVEYNGKKFDTLSDAMEAVEGNEAELVILKDTVINETVFIPASMKVSVVPKDGAVISRGADFKDTLFSVSGTLVLKGTMQINGSASAEADAPAFKVDGALELGNSVIISNHNNTTSTVSINGGKVTMTGGSISGNMASNGAVGIFGGSFVMKGGSISTNTTVNGGGVYIGKNSSFDMQGGRIYDNSASLGSCVYNAGTLTLSGDATLLSRNNSIAMIYLDAYTLVNVAAGWTPSVVNGYANVISVGMKTYNINTEVVSFADAAREDAFILAGAPEKLVLKVKDSTKLIIASEDGDIAYFNNKGYPTLEEAFAAVPENGAGTVYLVGDAEVAATIVIKQGQNVVLSVTDDPVVQADYTQRRVIRKGEFADVIFNVEKGATLTFGAPAEKNLVIDGELKSVNNSAVIVSGVFNLEAGASVVNNNFNKVENIDGKLMTLGGGIRVEKGGVFMLSGGTVSGCYASFGGGIYVNDGTLNISNGNITSNSALIGGGVYLHTEKTAAPVQENAPVSDETVQSYRALLNMTGGSVSLNKATENKKITGAGIGGGIFVGNGSYTILSGGKLFNNTALKGAGVGVGSAPENADDDPVPSDFIINDKMFIAEKDSVYLAYPELSVITMTETKLSEQKTPILLEIPDFMPQNMPLIHYVKELPLAYEEETESGETETKPSDKKEEEKELTAAPLLEKEIFKKEIGRAHV